MRRNFTQTCLKYTVCISLTLTSLALSANPWSSDVAAKAFFVMDTLIQPSDTTVLLTCEDSVNVCVGIPFAVINNYQLFENGNVYGSGISGCDYDTLSTYRYESLTGQGNSGPYVLQSWRINNDLFSSTFNSIPELVDSLNVWDATGGWVNNTTDLQITGGDPTNEYSDMIVFEIIPGTPRTLLEMETIVANATQVRVASGFNEVVVREISTSRSDTFAVWTACVNPSTETIDLVLGDSLDTCLDLTELLTDLDRVIAVEQPGNNNARFSLINNDSCLRVNALTEGLDSIYVVSCDDMDVCDTAWYIASIRPPVGFTEQTLMPYVGDIDTICYDLSAIGGSADTIYNICEAAGGTFVNFTLDTVNNCVIAEAIDAGGTDMACIVVCSAGVCDTTQYNVSVLRRGPEIVNRTIFLNQSDSYCEFSLTNIFSDVDSMYNYCEVMMPEHVSFTVEMKAMCVDYTGLSVGVDTACIVISDDAGNQDTTWLIVSTILPTTEIIPLTINFNDRIDLCGDSTELGAPVDTVYFCATPTTNVITIDSNFVNLCSSIVADSVAGMDTVCIVVCDDSLVCDTTIYHITVIDPSLLPQAMPDAISTDENNSVVVNILANDTIPGSPLDWTYTVIVSPTNGSLLDNNDGTITYTPGTDFCGTDQFTYEVCNLTGCDTTDVVISVNCSNSTTPVAVDDVVTTTINNNVTIDILRNDNLPGSLSDISYFVIDPNFGGTGPNNGSYLDNMDGTITYIPDSAFCNGMDTFSYVVCSGTISNCDTAMVMVMVSCTSDTASLKVFNAFSPNNDGNNDCFFVRGIENLTDNNVYIYNRWGNLVYQAINYDNENDCWNGTWKGTDLPDGTYFYVITGGTDTKVSGYVVIQR